MLIRIGIAIVLALAVIGLIQLLGLGVRPHTYAGKLAYGLLYAGVLFGFRRLLWTMFR